MTTEVLEKSASPTLSFRMEMRRARTRRRDLANARAKTRIDPVTVADPLLREKTKRSTRVFGAARFVAGAIGLHACLLLVATAAPGEQVRRPAYLEPIEVRVWEAPHVDPPPEVAPPPPPRPTQAPTPAPSLVKRPVETTNTPPPPPPDPTELPPPPPTAEPAKETPRRIVGLSLESTTTGSAAEAFAVGNTRMGQTSTVAENPYAVQPLSHSYVPPRRTKVYRPPYPASLRGKALHGEVGLRVDIDATGMITGVSIVRPSAYPEFNAAAADAAHQCTYEPAKLDGAPVPRSIEFSVQFQPNN